MAYLLLAKDRKEEIENKLKPYMIVLGTKITIEKSKRIIIRDDWTDCWIYINNNFVNIKTKEIIDKEKMLNSDYFIGGFYFEGQKEKFEKLLNINLIDKLFKKQIKKIINIVIDENFINNLINTKNNNGLSLLGFINQKIPRVF
ncbi:MAG: hypothetical protein SNJ64_04170 [Endomicrobiia bacterium]